MARLYCALVHHPVRGRANEEVTTSVTNMDVHDIARSAQTYGLAGYYIVCPIEAQHPVVHRIVAHWCEGSGRTKYPERAEAMALVSVRKSVADVITDIEIRDTHTPRVLATSARKERPAKPTTYSAETERLHRDTDPPTLVLFGTGHGLADRVLDSVDALLPPIDGPGPTNHLSVRAAAAITFDRLLGVSAKPSE